MFRSEHTAGYTLVELLAIITVIGAIAAIALPLYGAQMDAARLVKTRKHYDDAVRIARQEFVKDRQRRGLGQAGSLPEDSMAWIQRFDADGSAIAPGGGAAFVAVTPGGDIAGDPLTGAIGVSWNAAAEALTLTRPAYAGSDAASTTLSTGTSATIQLSISPSGVP